MEKNDSDKKAIVSETVVDPTLLERPIPISNIKNETKPMDKHVKTPLEIPTIEHTLSHEKPHNLESLPETGSSTLTVKEWFEKFSWKDNPFTLGIYPSLFVGYQNQTTDLLNSIYAKHKMSLVIGPTGSGKTTLLKWIEKNVNSGTDTIYISKMPEKVEEFVDIFNEKYKAPWILRWFIPNIKNIYQVPERLNKKTKNKHLLVMCDEIHETNYEVLEWIRVLSDQVDNMSLVLSGLPIFDEMLREKLETFRKRITTRAELLSLTKEETKQLIEKRITSMGGKGIEPFTEDVIDKIFQRTGGFPREILKACDDLVLDAISKGIYHLDTSILEVKSVEKTVEQISFNILEELTPLQTTIIDIIGSKECTPGYIVNTMGTEGYKSRQHAVRSINNILKRMMKDGLMERKKDGKAFLYVLSPKVRTLAVKS